MYPYICNGWCHLSPLSSHPTSPSCQFSDESAKAIFSEHAGVKKAWLQKPRAQATSGMRLVQVDVEGRTDGARICVPAWNAVVTAKSYVCGADEGSV